MTSLNRTDDVSVNVRPQKRMNKMKPMELILTRKSVRTFDGRELSAEDRDKLQAYMANIRNPYGIPVEFV